LDIRAEAAADGGPATSSGPSAAAKQQGRLEFTVTDLKYPEMREELIDYLQSLSDREYQIRIWVNKNFPTPKYFDSLTMTLQLLEDLGVFRDPEKLIGTIFKNQEEVTALARLSRALDFVFSLYGNDLPDSIYIQSSEWDDVISEATAALKTVRAADS
jgi:hypothetical protein